MLEDIRLTPDEKIVALLDAAVLKGEKLTRPEEFEAIANAAIDKAIKKIDEMLIFNMRDVGGINPEWAISDKNYKALKKLAKKGEVK